MKTGEDFDTVTFESYQRNIVDETLEQWPSLTPEERKNLFLNLQREDEDELFLRLNSHDQAEILSNATLSQRKIWIRLLAPDDAADVIQERPVDERDAYLELLDPQTRVEVRALLAYREDQAGGLMSPRFARVRPEMSVEEALRYMRVQTRADLETIYYAYALDHEQRLLGVVSLRQLFASPAHMRVDEIMVKHPDLIAVKENEDQEIIARYFAKWNFYALPVLDDLGHMKGIVTVDDMVGIVQKEASEDIQKFGGVEALDAPYFNIKFLHMIQKRAGWLLALFIGEMFTATAMGHFEHQISSAVVLALFIPLIISSGGNTGSQASTLVIRAMALGEIRLRDWWRVMIREVASGLFLGAILGCVGMMRIFLWPSRAKLYGEHYMLVSATVGLSLVGIVLWGTLVGAMLPFIFRLIKVDPATASAPFVATIVDVTGLVIYFSVASIILSGTLL
jgi:magnesium transporter